jgi:hypothetical protein
MQGRETAANQFDTVSNHPSMLFHLVVIMQLELQVGPMAILLCMAHLKSNKSSTDPAQPLLENLLSTESTFPCRLHVEVPAGFFWARGRTLPCPKGSYRAQELPTTDSRTWTCTPCGLGITTSGPRCTRPNDVACTAADACNRRCCHAEAGLRYRKPRC